MRQTLSTFKIIFITCILIFIGCENDKEKEVEKENDNNTKVNGVQLKIEGVVTINFPEGSISSETPKAEKVVNTEYNFLFEDLIDLNDVAKKSDFLIKLDIGENEPPFEENINVSFNIPDNWMNIDISSEQIHLFALIYQKCEENNEIIDHFEIIPSEINSKERVISASLPYWAFTNERSGRYETYLTIATTTVEDVSKYEKNKNLSDCHAETICPTISCHVNSPYNLNRLHPVKNKILPHYGTDFKAPIGTPIYAVADGLVDLVAVQKDTKKTDSIVGYGLYIKIKHVNSKYESRYAHLSRTFVKKGDKVIKGQKIAESGNTGIGTGPHLHFEFRHKNGKQPIDQYPCINQNALPTVQTGEVVVNIDGSYIDVSGNVTDDGGGYVYEKGLCIGLEPDPTGKSTYAGTGIGSFSCPQIGLEKNKKYYIRAYASNNIGTSYGATREIMIPKIEIGQEYGGGFIIHIDEENRKLYIFAPCDQSTGIEWYLPSEKEMQEFYDAYRPFPLGPDVEKINWPEIGLNDNITISILGKGKEFTQKITSKGSKFLAANICANLSLNGYSDWFLPNYKEMSLLRGIDWGLAQQWGPYSFPYWTSSESSKITAGVIDTGWNWEESKYYKNAVRCMRTESY